MPIRIVPYTAGHELAVRELNQRLLVDPALEDLTFPVTADGDGLPGTELFVALEDGAVRGGYILRRQQFFVRGEAFPVAHYRLPVSEGAVNRSYAALGLRLVRDALGREPRLYALGMGGWNQPLPKMLKRLGWRMCAVPFHFKVVHPFRFLREIRALRTTVFRCFLMDAAAFSGAGWLGMKLLGIARRTPPANCETASSFDGWGDVVWERCRP